MHDGSLDFVLDSTCEFQCIYIQCRLCEETLEMLARLVLHSKVSGTPYPQIKQIHVQQCCNIKGNTKRKSKYLNYRSISMIWSAFTNLA